MQSPATDPQPPSASPPPPPAEPGAPSGDSPNAPAPEAAPPDVYTIGGPLLERLRAAGARQAQTVEQYLEQVLSGMRRDPVPFYPTNADEMWRYAQMLAQSSFLPKAFYDKETGRARVGNVHLVLMKGHDLGIQPMSCIGAINIIDGKAEVGALMMVALIRKSGICETWQLKHSDERSATYITKRIGDEEPVEFTYTIEEADQMGLLDKGKSDWARENNQWKKQPRTMLRRRCQSMLAREVYPDVVLGLYDHDELSEMRERERALGIDPDRVIPMNGLGMPTEPSNGIPAALPAGVEHVSLRAEAEALAAARDATVRARREPEDPLKARLRERKAERAEPLQGALPLGPGETHCRCGVPVLGPKGTLCPACATS